ncbi:hypothetical protein Sjap_008792 [Stephania japonica]|uniref:R13L1/DRL21-like LRR repeat region domain-containing protein n=1 Tax=Stephania japonica TaxID=461633 RepID=A0AAP0JRT0_9MAGN
MGNSDKEGPQARLGHHAKAKTYGPWSGHPEPVGLDPEPRLSTQHAWTRPGTTRHSPCPLEKHGPRSLKRGRPSRGEEEDGRGIRELECLNNLCGHLRIHNMERVRDASHVRKAKLMEKGKVYQLEMVWKVRNADEGTNMTDYSEVVEALELPPNLIELSINGFPDVKLPWTTVLEISPFWVENSTTTLNSFPFLEELIVEECSILRIAPSDFPAVKEITLNCVGKEGVSSLLSQPWSVTSLEKLRIKNCPELSLTLTSTFSSLKEIYIFNIGGLDMICSSANNDHHDAPSYFLALEKLRIKNCPELSLTLSSTFPSLKEIYIYEIHDLDVMCSSANNDPRRHHLPSLTSIHVERVPEFTDLPKGFLQSSSSEHLQSVSIWVCDKFLGFVDVEGPELPLLFSSNLKQIKLLCCGNLESINVRGLTSLETLEITYCSWRGLESSIIGLQSLQALKKLTLYSVPIIMLSGEDAISDGCCWPHLEILNILGSRNVTLTASHLPSLKVMQIDCTDIEPITNDDILLPSLT